MDTDREYMKRAICLALGGRGFTNPNPLVGAVIVKDGRVIGEGYHEKYGGLHAERNAIKSLTEPAEGATIYVTLEPCCHYGKTPPCTEAIIENKIAHVVIGSRDPNPKVAGKGVKALRDAGIKVTQDYMRQECDRLNPVFFHYISTNTPYVVMKYAMTADGKIATKTGKSKWITCEESREYVQQLRSRYMGIMAGIGTVLADDPMLNVRVQGKRNPVRIICDTNVRIPLDSRLCKSAGEFPLIIACAGNDASEEPVSFIQKKREKIEALKNIGVQVLEIPRCIEPSVGGRQGIDLNILMDRLGGMGIDSILLEGGGTLNEGAFRAGIVNEVNAFIAPKVFGGSARTPVDGAGVESPDECYELEFVESSVVGSDILITYRVKNNLNERIWES
ncbi:MAG: bifunctional diaminohydroxyphosphoribosylaminopyrimidine deaminase/5-amino-6-(5-phosphoribosylamino)uracil reductase RibD [Lachnospiraceae bacterium]|nr:bifunctional diaminohydroxyphosphoribosylaminopyrimidine deaminase/5-amino-6-(5-phosphoribosylamino)uracil reductase RibD [Lachnospiraceae bacterium]